MADEMAPLVRQEDGYAPAAAQGDDESTAIATAEFGGTVTSAKWIANAAVTGQDTNTRKLDLVNKGTDGSGSTVVATLQFDNGTDATAMDETTLVVDTSNNTVTDGQVLALDSTSVGTGMADPGGKVVIEITRDDDAS